MVAVLAGIIVALLIIVLGMWATIDAKQARIDELEALHTPPTAPPKAVARARTREEPLDRATDTDLPKLFDMEGNDEPTKVSSVSP